MYGAGDADRMTQTVNITFRAVLQGSEVGTIIGKGGDTIRLYREASGAQIKISDNYGPTAQRIVTVVGTAEVCLKAFTLIVGKIEDDNRKQVPPPPVTVKVLLPEDQFQVIMGPDSSKLKEIVSLSNSDVQLVQMTTPSVLGDRLLSVTGSAESICQTFWQFSLVMVEHAPREARLAAVASVRAKPLLQQAAATGGSLTSSLNALPGLSQFAGFPGVQPQPLPNPMEIQPNVGCLITAAAEIGTRCVEVEPGLLAGPGAVYEQSQKALLQALRNADNPPANTFSVDVEIPDELAGLVIGKGGHRINDVRRLSGASVKITDQSGSNRTISITGTKQAVEVAQFYINTRCLGFTY